MIYSCQPSGQQKSGDHIKVLQRDIRLLHEVWVPHHSSTCRWRPPPLHAMIYEKIPGGTSINITSANEHVPEIECQIRVVTDRTKYVRHILTFKNSPKLLTIYIVFTVVRILKYSPFKGGVSAVLSPKTIMYGDTIHYKKHLGINIGHYCQVHENEDPRSSQVTHTKCDICLGTIGNEQGVFLFMSLNSLKKITIRSWDTIPMPNTIIAQVNKIPYKKQYQFIFTDCRGSTIGDIKITRLDKDSRDAADRNKN